MICVGRKIDFGTQWVIIGVSSRELFSGKVITMLELITEAMARGMEFKWMPGHFECEEYVVTYKDGVYRLADLVSPVTGQFNTPMEVMTFIHQHMNG